MAIENDMEFSIFPSDQIIVTTPVDEELNPDSENPVSGKVIYEELNKKSDKSDTYTKEEIKELIKNTEVGLIFTVVQELPTENINKHIIYLVPKSASQNDKFDEYIYINGAWEHLGSSNGNNIVWVDKNGTVPAEASSNTLCFKIM